MEFKLGFVYFTILKGEIFLSFLKQILRDVPSQSSLLGRHGVHDSMPRCILPSLCISEEDCTTSLGTRFDVLGK